MGNSDGETSAKANKTSSAQEPPPTSSSSQAAVYPEWSGFQAYSPIPPHGFFPSPVASSPQGHPYMWGAQLMPPYGTPPHPYVMYPHAGLYAHPSLPPGSHPFVPYAMCSPNGNAADASGAAAAGEPDGKSSDGNEKSPLKKSKGSLGSLNMITGHKLGKTCGASNGALSQSGDSGSEDSSEGSDADSQNDTQQKPSGEQDSVDAEATQNGSVKSSNGVARTSQQIVNQPLAIVPMQVAGAPVTVTSPATNLNIGMDYWGAPATSSALPVRGKVPNAAVMGGLLPAGISGSRESLPSDLWLQDERELKRQKRKQSNRESARRSRLRKQAECEELALRVENLKEENSALRSEVTRLKQEYQQLLSQKTSLKEKLDAVSRGTVDTVDKAEQNAGENEKKEQLDVNAPDEAALADQSGT